MNPKITSLLSKKEIEIQWTDKPVTPWGGLSLFSGLAQQVGLVAALRKALPFHPTSPNATDPVEVALAFMAGVLAGSRRLAHIERLRWDQGVKHILGIKRFVSDTTLSRFFFLDETLALLPEGIKIPFLRADSGFGIETFLKKVEDRKFIYAITARFTKGLKNEVAKIQSWRILEPGIEVAETVFQAQGWSKARRVVVIRQRVKENDFVRGRELFDDPGYVYQAILSNRTDAPEDVWRFYRKHADIENQIRELKWDYGADGFCQKKFYATEAAFRMVCVTYNLVSLLQEKLGFPIYKTLGTLRSQLLTIGTIVGTQGRKTILRMSLQGKWRQQFEGYLKILYPTLKPNCNAVETG